MYRMINATPRGAIFGFGEAVYHVPAPRPAGTSAVLPGPFALLGAKAPTVTPTGGSGTVTPPSAPSTPQPPLPTQPTAPGPGKVPQQQPTQPVLPPPSPPQAPSSPAPALPQPAAPAPSTPLPALPTPPTTPGPVSPPPMMPPPQAPGTVADASVLAKAKAWWEARSGFEKGAVVVGGVTLAGLFIYATIGSRPMTPNLSSAERKRVASAKPGATVKVGGKSYKAGKIITLSGGDRFGHKVPPKKYRDAGAKRKSDYAWADGYKYPLVFRTSAGKVKLDLTQKRIRAAASYFGRNKARYPLHVRKEIARNINRAKRRYGIGGKPATP